MRARFLAFVLILSLGPATSELIEALVHYVEHGDLAHADADEHETTPLGTDEHGCSGTFHICSCHTVIAVAPVVTATFPSADHRHVADLLAPSGRDGEDASAPDIRPPIA